MSAHIACLDGPRLRRSLVAACDYTRQQRQELDRINVFPVSDGDTGTNLGLTVEAIADRLRRNRNRAVSAVADDAAEVALPGARGNSGIMLSHFLPGFAVHLKGRKPVGPRGFAQALGGGIDNPVESAVLTVIRDTANAAKESSATDFVPCVDRTLQHDPCAHRDPPLHRRRLPGFGVDSCRNHTGTRTLRQVHEARPAEKGRLAPSPQERVTIKSCV